VKALRFVPALLLLVLATAAALLAGDVRSWQRTLRSDDALLVVAPRRPTWHAPARLPFSLAERLLGVRDDVAARQAIRLFRETVSVTPRLDNAMEVAAARARAENALAAVARGNDLTYAAQADTLLGILAFGDLAHGGGTDSSQAEATVADFESAVRADPEDETAKYDLELVLRLLTARGVRIGPATRSAPGSTGRHGAAGGTPGQGY
jgi:hypothetical protein